MPNARLLVFRVYEKLPATRDLHSFLSFACLFVQQAGGVTREMRLLQIIACMLSQQSGNFTREMYSPQAFACM